MYQIKCDQYILYDPRHDKLKVNNPRCKLEVNTVGEASFTMYANHPYYDRLQKMRSIFEILQDGHAIFRGRMTEDSKDFNNIKVVDIEGVGAYFNDSVVRPFAFPEDFLDNADYIAAANGGNVVEFFLQWLIDNHNSQVEEFQRFKLGNVTVTDSTNYISRSSADYAKTWETLKSKLFDSGLGGYFCIRYEDDGNHIDYLADFELTNTQTVQFGKNLIDLITESNATAACSAVLPLGKKLKEIDENTDSEDRLTIAGLPDGDITEDIYKQGDLLISRSAKDAYGFIVAHTKGTTWDDVTEARNLQTKASEYLTTTASKLSNTITVTAVDLHFTDDEIAAFRIYRKIRVISKPHELEATYNLTKLDIDILNPQNTKITLGDTKLSMTDINRSQRQSLAEAVQNIKKQTTTQGLDLSDVQNIVVNQSTSTVATCEEIILAAMTDYVETGNYESFKETVESQLKILSEEVSVNISALTEQIVNVNGDLQAKFNQITKYFTFDINGLTIGQIDNPNKVVIDNDTISILVNDMVVQSFDSNGQALIPEVNITKKMNLLGYLIEEDEDGNVNCEYVGGDA